MTANIATPQSESPVGGPAGSVAEARTPFYNHLMTMIDATAMENRRASQTQDIAATPRSAGSRRLELQWGESRSGWVEPSWRISHLLTCAAGAVAAVAVASAVIASLSGLRKAPVAAADGGAPGQTPVMVASTAAPVVKAAPLVKADAVALAGSKSKEPAPSGQEPTAPSAARTDSPPELKPVPERAEAEPPSAAPKSEGARAEVAKGLAPETVTVRTVNVKIVGATTPAAIEPVEVSPPKADAWAPKADLPAAEADPPVSKTAAGADVVPPAEELPGKQPVTAEVVVSPPSSIETGSIESGPTAPSRIGRIASDVRLRAGPGNSHPVLGTLAKGTAVDVIGCRAWCEVIAEGQRGWIYKGFLDAR